MKRKERDHEEDNERDSVRSNQSKFNPIPLDLEVDILTRLPTKSLVKFRCVSTIWSSIIKSQRFVNSYYTLSSTTRSRFMIAFSNGALAKGNDKRLFIFSSSYEEEKSSSLVTKLDMTIPSLILDRGSNCSSVHGLIGVSNSGPFIVCNPSTKKITTLRSLPYILAARPTYLGYDPVNDQFKALTRISCSYKKDDTIVIYQKKYGIAHEVLTLGSGGVSSWTRNVVITDPYTAVTKGLCINGFIYYGAVTRTQGKSSVIVCFDVRDEKISFIKAPFDMMVSKAGSTLIEYKGKLASIGRHPFTGTFHSFVLWILEDTKKEDWSKQTFKLPFSLGDGTNVFSPGTNKAGEIIFALKSLSRDVQPFYIFYYSVERNDVRRVRLRGIADSKKFRQRYGHCCVYISPEHVESIFNVGA